MLGKLLPKKVQDIEEYRPNLAPCRIRLDANESPFLPSKAILDELANAVFSMDFNRYPDPYASDLIAAFAKIYNVDPQNVVAGNGSDELISLICSGLIEPGDTVSVVLPDFSMYEFYSSLAGANMVRFVKSETFEVNYETLLAEVKKNGSKIVILSNPCNPTGWVAKREEVTKFVRSFEGIAVIDEAYMEFSPENESVLDLAAGCENLIVLKTMSKAFGAAALRLGFAITNDVLASTIRKIKSPYNVNSVSQTFGKIILEHHAEIETHIRELKENTIYLRDQLAKIENSSIVRICPTAANFVYIKLASQELAADVKTRLMEQSIAIRCMSSGGYIRVTAGKRDEIDEFIHKFREVLS